MLLRQLLLVRAAIGSIPAMGELHRFKSIFEIKSHYSYMPTSHYTVGRMPILLGGDQIDAHGKGQRYVGRMKFMDIIELRAGPEIPVVEDSGRHLTYSDKACIP